MLRTPASGFFVRSTDNHELVDAISQGRLLGPHNVSSTLSAPDKHQIYKHWVASGKPHNLICTECRKPDNLMYCGSCCRSYHASCLAPADHLPRPDQFYCPGCRTGHLDRSSSMAPSISPIASRTGTPTVQGMGRGFISPSRPAGYNTISTSHSTSWSRQTTGASTPFTDHAMPSAPLPATLDPSILTRAREFLLTHGSFPDSQVFSPDLLLKLGSMMVELEDHRERAQDLLSENAHLRQDNANIRAYLDSNLATGRPPPQSGGDVSSISRPSPDTSGKSWDRIVMDLI